MDEDIKDGARCSRVYLAMAVLSTIVAAIGLDHNSVAIIIGAMVIAPLLGPNVALALGTTLGDLSLLWRALQTVLAGIATTIALVRDRRRAAAGEPDIVGGGVARWGWVLVTSS